jgi:HSP20 family protein
MFVHVRERRTRAPFARLERDVDRILRDFWSDWGTTVSDFKCDVAPDSDGVTIRADVPGVPASAINVAVDGRTLTISGERAAESENDRAYLVRERRSGTFSRTFYLADDLDSGGVEAECRDGVLSLRIPKRPEAKPRQIEVKSN